MKKSEEEASTTQLVLRMYSTLPADTACTFASVEFRKKGKKMQLMKTVAILDPIFDYLIAATWI